ncbi:DUF2058 domain-containing protein [Pseudoxanthomonas indica]|uniref:Uncharacterized conserved protein YaiL, DUF2058 family n=1 Tax=Pseudoxanthomonas indica TaxID=428993 RepID=A0A1T5INQ0_9GAMM|nr:DUF2058 family protein [Pseudoxanthomonas indica]GGD53243.1 hypothetical protein GCM10007235_26860 [Pseudoxanthomonas indica]SKC40658.1 Uncharacterized conserved protein YaiL, DUF2058 family [Pseudoxanthomonas indica]
MTDSLRDQLLGLGFKPAPKPERKPERRPDRKPDGKRHEGKRQDGGKRPAHAAGAAKGPHSGQPRNAGAKAGGQSRPARVAGGEMDLAKAYAIRAQKEKDERIEAERIKQEEARLRREAKARLEVLLKDQGLNDAGAEITRHFPYGGKIKRIYVNETQLKALNAGELGVVQLNGRYLLVTAAMLAEAEAVFAPCVALKVDPDAPAADDPYADPQFQVPDDLVW